MSKLTLDEVSHLHKTGQLAAAKQGYLYFLEDHPDDAQALNQLGLLYAEEGDLDVAQDYIEKALAVNPKKPSFHLNLANILKAKGLFSRAAQVLTDVVKAHPDYAAAFNNLGTVYYAQAKLAEAVSAFHSAIANAADYVDAYYNLALAFTKLGKRQEAINTYRALIELAPQHAGARFQLGCLLMEQSHYEAAIEQFSAIERDHPFHFETETNIATCYLKLRRLNEAKMHYLKALALSSQDTQILFNLGIISMQQGFPKEAVEYYLRLLKIDADHSDTHNNLAIVYLALQDKEAALNHFREALRLNPNNPTLIYIINMMTEAKHIKAAPPEYVQTLFDAYADHYDDHLTKSLQYIVPNELFDIVARVKTPPQEQWDILDLGCGTGLCGALFRPAADTLTGVDIAEQMLAIAQQKNIYDQLIKADILKYLHKTQDQYDLVLAADVLVYFGDLNDLISAIANVLKPQGLFAFNVEVSKENNYQLTSSGRFAHSKQYVENCAQKNNLEILMAKQGFMRKQAQEDVYGMYYVLGSSKT